MPVRNARDGRRKRCTITTLKRTRFKTYAWIRFLHHFHRRVFVLLHLEEKSVEFSRRGGLLSFTFTSSSRCFCRPSSFVVSRVVVVVLKDDDFDFQTHETM